MGFTKKKVSQHPKVGLEVNYCAQSHQKNFHQLFSMFRGPQLSPSAVIAYFILLHKSYSLSASFCKRNFGVLRWRSASIHLNNDEKWWKMMKIFYMVSIIYICWFKTYFFYLYRIIQNAFATLLMVAFLVGGVEFLLTFIADVRGVWWTAPNFLFILHFQVHFP